MDLLMNIHNEKETSPLTQIQTGGDYIPYDNTFVPTYGNRGVGNYRTSGSTIQMMNILTAHHTNQIPIYRQNMTNR